MENKIADRNYFLEKLYKDREFNNILEGLTTKEKNATLKDIEELRRILHLKRQVDKEIVKEYEEHIIVPEGTEETLIRELNVFNKQMYDDYPTYYTLEFDDLINENKKPIVVNVKVIKRPEPVPAKTYKKNILNLSEPVIQEPTQELTVDESVFNNEKLNEEKISTHKTDIIDDKVIQDKDNIFNTFKDFESKLTNNPVKIKVEHFDNLLVDYKTEGKEILDSQRDFVVDTEEQKQNIISTIKKTLKDGNYHKLNLTKSFSLSYSKFMNRLKKLKQSFITTYGSEIFSRIKDAIKEENALYENLDRSNNIKRLNLRKYKYKKKKF
ncbi:hypothetical protein SCORR_v1c04810 [Spiroplasma corruscae]|uniref:Uncharacterized protein n=1 Tax=Spiroplasma corruscae TaxID=216934 RepID=A0A222EPN1_9MOLU|nr:hypothetical protein [Spiroplasma corruscae]ASP28253.1 hypothetical protein SCORR_v1c04810 [Spiroplasma corruscae]